MKKLGSFFSHFRKLSFKKGQTILRADEEPPGVFFIKKGYVRLYSLAKNAQELTLIIFKPEDFFPVMWALNGTPNRYYLEAISHVDLYLAPRDKFVEFVKSQSDALYELTSKILIRMGGLLTRMEYLVFGNAYNKVASIISICGERFGKSYDGKIIIQVPLTHQDIADLIGAARETVSINIKKLENKGIIGYRGRHIVIRDDKALKKIHL